MKSLGLQSASEDEAVRRRKSRVSTALIAASAVVLVGLLTSLFAAWEIGGESWGNWFFAREFADTGKFPILGRAPIYSLYLAGFAWLGYPLDVTIEYLVTTAITLAALIWFGRSHLGLWGAVLAALLWLPFLQFQEPATQMLGLASLVAGVALRRGSSRPIMISGSYSLLLLGGLFRLNFLVFLAVVLAWDIARLARRGDLAVVINAVRPRVSLALLAIPIVLTVWFAAAQSEHRWNNAWFASTDYFPVDGKSMSDATVIANHNGVYMDDELGSPEGTDFYFTNEERFGGADTALGVIVADPVFSSKLVWRNTKTLVRLITLKTTVLDNGHARWASMPGSGLSGIVLTGMAALVAVTIFYGAWRAAAGVERVYVVGVVLLLLTTLLLLTDHRYFHPLIPVMIISAAWYGGRLKRLITRLPEMTRFAVPIAALALAAMGLIAAAGLVATDGQSDIEDGLLAVLLAASVLMLATLFVGPLRMSPRWFAAVGLLAVPVALVVFSTGGVHWPSHLRAVAVDVRSGDLHILERDSETRKGSYDELVPLLSGCRGIMTRDPYHLYLGAFTSLPGSRIYDVFEIAPFGDFENGPYLGLSPDRVDCVMWIAGGVGASMTNTKLRYENYVAPFVKSLEAQGASTHEQEKDYEEEYEGGWVITRLGGVP